MSKRILSPGSLTATRAYWLSTSPLWAYLICFALVFACYQVEWSTLYPALSAEIPTFLVATFVITLTIVGAEWLLRRARPAPLATWWTARRVRRATVLIYGLILLECVHAGGIPILLIFGGSEYDYRDFGIPTLHVVLYGVYWFLSVHWFSLWMTSRRIDYAWHCLALLAINLLIVNRGGLTQAILAIAVLYIVHSRLGVKALLRMIVLFVAVVLLFGIVGDARMVAMGIDPELTILALGEASARYPAETLSTGPFWLYLYASSPLANWQLNVTQATTIHVDGWTFFVIEMIPDFIGKRLLEPETFYMSPRLVIDALTVTSAFGRAFYLKGWAGCAMVYALLLLYYVAVRVAFRRTEYFDSAIACMASGAALMVYFNMLSFTGFVGPLLVAGLMRVFLSRRRGRSRRRASHPPAGLAELTVDRSGSRPGPAGSRA